MLAITTPIAICDNKSSESLWELLALSDSELERADLLIVNLTVASGIPSYKGRPITYYAQTLDEWTAQFCEQLPQMERQFSATPWKWKSDIRFFRVGMLQGFLGHEIGIRYIEDQ